MLLERRLDYKKIWRFVGIISKLEYGGSSGEECVVHMTTYNPVTLYSSFLFRCKSRESPFDSRVSILAASSFICKKNLCVSALAAFAAVADRAFLYFYYFRQQNFVIYFTTLIIFLGINNTTTIARRSYFVWSVQPYYPGTGAL